MTLSNRWAQWLDAISATPESPSGLAATARQQADQALAGLARLCVTASLDGQRVRFRSSRRLSREAQLLIETRGDLQRLRELEEPAL
jgi:hypothetical protein